VAVQNGEAVFEKKLDGNGVAFSPDGRRLAVGSYGAVHLLDVPSGTELRQINFQKPSQWPEFQDVSVRTVAFSPDGNRIAAGGGDRVRIYDSSGKQLTEMPHPAEVDLVRFHPNGLWLATGCDDKSVRFMDARTGALLWRLSLETVPSVLAFSKDGRELTVGTADGDIRVHDVFSHDELAQTWRPGDILALAYSDDNRRLLEGFAENEKIAAWGSEFISISDVLSDACSHVTANLSKEDWRRYFGDERYRKTCPAAP
jgi:WD40 repeat protein